MLAAIETWLTAHPVARGILWMIGLAVAGTIYNWITFKRSEAEWAAYELAYPRKAAFIRLMRALFPHLRKIPAIAAFLPPPDPPSSRRAPRSRNIPTAQRDMRFAKLGVAGIVALAMTLLLACSGPRSAADVTRDVARGAVLVVVEAVDAGDVVCANIAARAKGSADDVSLRKGIALAGQCERAKDAALVAAKAARIAINSWDSASAGKLACAGAQALTSLNLMRDAATRAGQAVPALLEDGIAQASVLARMLPVGASCELSTSGAT